MKKMNKKRGFTLVETLAIIVILGIIVSLTIVSYINIRKTSLDKELENKMILLESAAYQYGEDNKNDIWELPTSCGNIDIKTLIEEGYIKSESEVEDVLINPKTEKPLQSVYKICYINNGIIAELVIGNSIYADPNGGLYGDSTESKAYRGIIKNATQTLTVPTRKWYLFDGWEKVSGTGYSVNGNVVTMGTEDVYLRAKWKEDGLCHNDTDFFTVMDNVSYPSDESLKKKILTDPESSKCRITPTLSKVAVSQELYNSIPAKQAIFVVENAIYKAQDNDGNTFVYRGQTEKNYVLFAGFWWRIMRVNGDGSIRLVLDGLTSTVKKGSGVNVKCNSGCAGGDSKYYNTYSAPSDAVMYQAAGYKGNPIVTPVNAFYTNYLINYKNYLADSIFCNDTNYNKDSNQGDGIDYAREYSLDPQVFTRIISYRTAWLTCKSNAVKTVANGNLSYPIALPNIEEVVYAGAIGWASWSYSNNIWGPYNQVNPYPLNISFYLYNPNTVDRIWWVMSPDGTSSGVMYHLNVNSNGAIYTSFPNATHGVRPVINLRADIKVTGSGTKTDPYVPYL